MLGIYRDNGSRVGPEQGLKLLEVERILDGLLTGRMARVDEACVAERDIVESETVGYESAESEARLDEEWVIKVEENAV